MTLSHLLPSSLTSCQSLKCSAYFPLVGHSHHTRYSPTSSHFFFDTYSISIHYIAHSAVLFSTETFWWLQSHPLLIYEVVAIFGTDPSDCERIPLSASVPIWKSERSVLPILRRLVWRFRIMSCNREREVCDCCDERLNYHRWIVFHTWHGSDQWAWECFVFTASL